MSWQHPPEALLQRFVDGDLGEQHAVSVALHIDDCPECAARAVAMDPLSAVFAATSDPVIPADLTHGIMDAARQRQPPGPEPAIAVGLLTLSALVLFIGGDIAGLFVRGAATLSAAFTVLGATLSQVGLPSMPTAIPAISPATWALLASVMLVMSVASVRRMEARRQQ